MTHQGSVRHVPNEMPDYDASLQHRNEQGPTPHTQPLSFLSTSEYSRLHESVRSWLLQGIQLVMKTWPPSSPQSPTSVRGQTEQDFSIYIGTGGNAYLHWKLSRFFEAEGDEEKQLLHRGHAVTAINVALSQIPSRPRKGEGIAFYIGNAGIHSLAAAIFSASGDHSKASRHLSLLLGYVPSALDSSAADEILYGRAGYLFSLLFAKKHVAKELLEGLGLEAAMKKVFDAIMKSGKKRSGSSQSVLQYHFYGTDYHGAAHGTVGILYILLQFPEWCKQPDTKPFVQATLDHMLSLQFPSGNFPLQAQSNDRDEQIHWCHGAPGFVYTLYHAHSVFGGERYKFALDRALDVVWQRGVIKKGLGLCHGIAGNAYAFLMMYRYTGEEKHIYRAFKMAELMQNDKVLEAIATQFDPQRKCQGIADFPYSLMEGLAGTICYHCDLLHPQTAAFPGYDGEVCFV